MSTSYTLLLNPITVCALVCALSYCISNDIFPDSASDIHYKDDTRLAVEHPIKNQETKKSEPQQADARRDSSMAQETLPNSQIAQEISSGSECALQDGLDVLGLESTQAPESTCCATSGGLPFEREIAVPPLVIGPPPSPPATAPAEESVAEPEITSTGCKRTIQDCLSVPRFEGIQASSSTCTPTKGPPPSESVKQPNLHPRARPIPFDIYADPFAPSTPARPSVTPHCISGPSSQPPKLGRTPTPFPSSSETPEKSSNAPKAEANVEQKPFERPKSKRKWRKLFKKLKAFGKRDTKEEVMRYAPKKCEACAEELKAKSTNESKR